MTYPFEPCACGHVRAAHKAREGVCSGKGWTCVCPGFSLETVEFPAKLDYFKPELLIAQEQANTRWLHDVVEQLMELAALGYDNMTFRVEGNDYVVTLRKEKQ